MIRLDEDALICDLAETYHIYNYRTLTARFVSVLAVGLKDSSRIKLKVAGVPVSLETLLMATIADRIEAIRFGFSKEAERGTKPISLVEQILGEPNPQKNKTMTFASGEDFRKAYAKLIGSK